MDVDWTYDGCDSNDERAIEQVWEEFQLELEAKVAELAVDPVALRLVVTRDSESDVWELQAALHLTTRTLVADNVGESLDAIFGQTVAHLLRAVDKEGSRPTEASRRLQGLQAILPLLERNRSERRSHQFFVFLGPLVQTLRTHTQRELELLELEGALVVKTLEVDDVLDEAMLRAWEAFDERPGDLPLDLWLISLLHGVLADYTRDPLPASLQAERDVSLPEQDEQTSAITWIEQVTYPETVELSDLLPGEPGIESWDRLDFDTKQTKLAELLSYLSRDHRQLLVLNAVEGFEPEQIAALQQRSLEEVQADLKESRRRLSAALRNLERKTV